MTKQCRPPAVEVEIDGKRYERDLARCRRALLDVEVTDGFDNMTEFARSVRLGRSTVATFFNGSPHLTPDTVRRILRGLQLRFEDVHRPIDPAGPAPGSDS